MAMTINSSPVLTGESAKIFYEEAEKNSCLATPKLSEEKEEELRKMEEDSRNFTQYLLNKIYG